MNDMMKLKDMIESEIEELKNIEMNIADDEDSAHTIGIQISTLTYVLDLIEGI